LEAQLREAKEKAENETAKLVAMRQSYLNAYPLSASFSNSFETVSDDIAKTDIFFDNPNTDDPSLKLKTKNESLRGKVEKAREEVNNIIAEWNKIIAINEPEKIDKSSLEKMIDDMKKISVYVQELRDVISSLNPKESGLSQSEIYSDLSIVQIVNRGIESTIKKMQETIEVGSGTGPSSDSDNNSPASQNQNVPDQQDIVNQERIVSDINNNIINIENDLNMIDEEIRRTGSGDSSAQNTGQKSSGSSDGSGSSSGSQDPSTPNTGSSTQPIINSGGNTSVNKSSSNSNTTSGGKTKPKLIQGSNTTF
jgi:hypothetical protein